MCAPARAALLTGRYPHRTGALDTLEQRGLDRIALRERTIADHFGAAGYATGLVGKWHNGALDPRYHPNRRGFDEFAGFSGGWSHYVDYRLDRNGARHEERRPLHDRRAHRRGGRGSSSGTRREPFFLMLAYSAPHFPFHALEDDLAPFRDTGAYTTAVSHIYGMIRSMDRGVARVLDALDRLGLAENTIVLFTSDNGPQFSGSGEMDSRRFNCGFAGAKLLVYEGGIRVPMIVRWPAGLEGGRQIDGMVHFTDWLPTLLAAAGVEPPRDMRSTASTCCRCCAARPRTRRRSASGSGTATRPPAECNAAMRDGRWKLVLPAIGETMAVGPGDLMMDAVSSAPERSPRSTPGPSRNGWCPTPDPRSSSTWRGARSRSATSPPRSRRADDDGARDPGSSRSRPTAPAWCAEAGRVPGPDQLFLSLPNMSAPAGRRRGAAGRRRRPRRVVDRLRGSGRGASPRRRQRAARRPRTPDR